MRRFVAVWLAVTLLAVLPGTTSAATTLPGKVSALEEVVYGREQTGSLVERLNRLERDLYGETRQGPLLARAEEMHQSLVYGKSAGDSLMLKLNAVEWMIYQELTTGQPLSQRVEHVEQGVTGERGSGSLQERIARLVEMVWPGGRLNVREVQLPKETLVRIRLLDEVHSGKNRVDQTIRFRVADDVTVDGRVVIPSGTPGAARVTKVDSAGNLGRSGRVELDFGTVYALDGTPVRLRVAEHAAKQNTELAAAASIAGVALLGPIGLVGGYFVQGREHVIPAGTEFYVELEREVKALGLSLTPAGL